MVNTELQKEKNYLSHVYQQLLQTLQKLVQTAKEDGLASLREMGKDVSLNFDSALDNLDTFSMLEIKNREIDQMNIRIQSSERTFQQVQETSDVFYFGPYNFTNEVGETLIFD